MGVRFTLESTHNTAQGQIQQSKKGEMSLMMYIFVDSAGFCTIAALWKLYFSRMAVLWQIYF